MYFLFYIEVKENTHTAILDHLYPMFNLKIEKHP